MQSHNEASTTMDSSPTDFDPGYFEDSNDSSEFKSSQATSGSSDSHQAESDVSWRLPASGAASSSARLSNTEPIISKNSREFGHPDEDTSPRGEDESPPRSFRQKGKERTNTSHRRKALLEIAPNNVPSRVGPPGGTTTALNSGILSEDLKPPSFVNFTQEYGLDKWVNKGVLEQIDHRSYQSNTRRENIVYIARSTNTTGPLWNLKIGRVTSNPDSAPINRRNGQYQKCGMKFEWVLPVRDAPFVEGLALDFLQSQYSYDQARGKIVNIQNYGRSIPCPCGKKHNDLFTSPRKDISWLKNLLEFCRRAENEKHVYEESLELQNTNQPGWDYSPAAVVPPPLPSSQTSDSSSSQTNVPPRRSSRVRRRRIHSQVREPRLGSLPRKRRAVASKSASKNTRYNTRSCNEYQNVALDLQAKALGKKDKAK